MLFLVGEGICFIFLRPRLTFEIGIEKVIRILSLLIYQRHCENILDERIKSLRFRYANGYEVNTLKKYFSLKNRSKEFFFGNACVQHPHQFIPPVSSCRPNYQHKEAISFMDPWINGFPLLEHLFFLLISFSFSPRSSPFLLQ